jgi:DNA mismatch repair ATPase MutS
VDEVLRGTNTVERVSASTEILKSFADDKERNVLCYAATHDIELTHLLEEWYGNYHFEEQIVDDDVLFNYELNSGRATSRNAISLLKVMGYDEEIIKAARARADRFTETGKY